MKHRTFKRFLCMAMALVMALSAAAPGIGTAKAAETVTTTIPHTQTEGDSNLKKNTSLRTSAHTGVAIPSILLGLPMVDNA